MSALHQQHLTPTQQASNEHHKRLLANIETRAKARQPVVVPIKVDGLDELHTKVRWAITKIDALSKQVFDRSSEIEALQSQLATLKPKIAANGRATCKEIIRVTAEFCGYSIHDICSHRRDAHLVRARHLAMYLCRALTTRSLPYIGQQFGGRDHTTIMHAERRVHGLIASGDAEMTQAVDFLMQRFGGAE